METDIDDSYLQAQSEQQQQEFALWLYQQWQLIEQANIELQIEGRKHEQIRHTA